MYISEQILPDRIIGFKAPRCFRQEADSQDPDPFHELAFGLKQAMLTFEMYRCGTTSPDSARECIEFNCARTWGFVTDCNGLEQGVQAMLEAR